MREKKEKQGEHFDKEEYDYLVYREIELLYKNGERRSIAGASGYRIETENGMEENRENEKMGNLRIFFAEKIDIDNVKAIIIDGKECPTTSISK